MSSPQQLLAEVRERRAETEAFDRALDAAGAQPFGSPGRRVAYGTGLGLIVGLAIVDQIGHPGLWRGPLLAAVFGILGFAAELIAQQRKKTRALLWLIEKESAGLHGRSSNGAADG